MTGNVRGRRTELPSQTVLEAGDPFPEPSRVVTVIEAPSDHPRTAVEGVVAVRQLVTDARIRLLVVDPTTDVGHLFGKGEGEHQAFATEVPDHAGSRGTPSFTICPERGTTASIKAI